MFKFMLTILGAVAEMERELTVVRIREGLAKAKRCGTKTGRPIGRPPREMPASFKKYYRMWKIVRLRQLISQICSVSVGRHYITTSGSTKTLMISMDQKDKVRTVQHKVNQDSAP